MKDAIFYSNYCSYCKQLLELLEKKNVKAKFIPICVDNRHLNLPKSIQQVPTMIVDNKFYVGQQCFDYIMKTYKDEQINTWDFQEMANFSSGYSFIEDDSNSSVQQGFVYLNQPSEKIVTPKEGSSKNQSLDSLMQKRKQQYSNQFQRMGGGGSNNMIIN